MASGKRDKTSKRTNRRSWSKDVKSAWSYDPGKMTQERFEDAKVTVDTIARAKVDTNLHALVDSIVSEKNATVR